MSIKEIFEKIKNKIKSIFSKDETKSLPSGEQPNITEEPKKGPDFKESLSKETAAAMEKKKNEENLISMGEAIVKDLNDSVEEILKHALQEKGVDPDLIKEATKVLISACEERNGSFVNEGADMKFKNGFYFSYARMRENALDQETVKKLEENFEGFIEREYKGKDGKLDEDKLMEAEKSRKIDTRARIGLSIMDTLGKGTYTFDRLFRNYSISIQKEDAQKIMKDTDWYLEKKRRFLYGVRSKVEEALEFIEISQDGKKIEFNGNNLGYSYVGPRPLMEKYNESQKQLYSSDTTKRRYSVELLENGDIKSVDEKTDINGGHPKYEYDERIRDSKGRWVSGVQEVRRDNDEVSRVSDIDKVEGNAFIRKKESKTGKDGDIYSVTMEKEAGEPAILSGSDSNIQEEIVGTIKDGEEKLKQMMEIYGREHGEDGLEKK